MPAGAKKNSHLTDNHLGNLIIHWARIPYWVKVIWAVTCTTKLSLHLLSFAKPWQFGWVCHISGHFYYKSLKTILIFVLCVMIKLSKAELRCDKNNQIFIKCHNNKADNVISSFKTLQSVSLLSHVSWLNWVKVSWDVTCTAKLLWFDRWQDMWWWWVFLPLMTLSVKEKKVVPFNVHVEKNFSYTSNILIFPKLGNNKKYTNLVLFEELI